MDGQIQETSYRVGGAGDDEVGHERLMGQIRAFTPERYPHVEEVLFVNIPWAEAIVVECEALFERFKVASETIRWKWLAFYGMEALESNNHSLLGRVIESSMTQFPSRGYFFSGRDSEVVLDSFMSDAISKVLTGQPRHAHIPVESIRIDSFTIPNASMFQICRYLQSRGAEPQKGDLGLCKLILRDVLFCEFHGGPFNGASDILATALSSNTCLEELELFQLPLDDGRMARILSALSGHPRIQQLNIGHRVFEVETSRALRQLVDSTRIKGLRFVTTINHSFYATSLEGLIAHLPPSTSLESLELSFNYIPSPDCSEDFQYLLSQLREWPNLRSLNLEKYGTSSLLQGDFDAHTITPTGLRNIYLDFPEPLNWDASRDGPSEPWMLVMLQLLKDFPRLGYIGKGHGQELSQYVQYPEWLRRAMDMNRSCMHLIRGQRLSLVLWPSILARTRKDCFFGSLVDRQANALFQLLQSSTFQLYFDLHVQDLAKCCNGDK